MAEVLDDFLPTIKTFCEEEGIDEPKVKIVKDGRAFVVFEKVDDQQQKIELRFLIFSDLTCSSTAKVKNLAAFKRLLEKLDAKNKHLKDKNESIADSLSSIIIVTSMDLTEPKAKEEFFDQITAYLLGPVKFINNSVLEVEAALEAAN